MKLNASNVSNCLLLVYRRLPFLSNNMPFKFVAQKRHVHLPIIFSCWLLIDDIDANYLQIERRKIETEPFYRTIDRTAAEDILLGREDGTCLVRPYKETVSKTYLIFKNTLI